MIFKTEVDVFYDLLLRTEEEGMIELVDFLKKVKFHELPASIGYHNNVKGGLLKHSMSVFEVYKMHANLENVSGISIIKMCLLHDVCKIYDYTFDEKGNPIKRKGAYSRGHGKLSVQILENFIFLTGQEKLAIQYHMSHYKCKERDKYGEYYLNQMQSAYTDPYVKMLSFADDISTNLYEN